MKRVVFVLFSFLSCLLSAQDFQPTSIHLTVQNGLAGDNVYFAMQDRDGYLWFGTETGVSRYNGREFENFYMRDGLPDNEIFRIDQDSQGRIWFSAFNGKAGYYYQGQFFNATNDSTLARLKANSYYLNMFEDSDKNLWFAFRWGMAMVGHDGTVLHQNDFPYAEEIRIANFIEKGGEVWGGSNHHKQALLLLKQGNRLDSANASVRRDGDFSAFIYNSKGYLSADRPFEISKFLKNILQNEDFEVGRSSKLHNYQDNFIWACTFKGALRVDVRTKTAQRFFNGKHISHVLKDREGGHWFITLEEGIYYVPRISNSSITHIDNQPIGNIMTLFSQDQTLWFGATDARLGFIQKDTSSMSSFSLRHGRSRIRQILAGKHKGEILIVAEEAIILRKADGTYRRLKGSVKSMSQWGDSLYVAGTYAVFYVLGSDILYAGFENSRQMNDPELYDHFRKETAISQHAGIGSTIDIEPYGDGLMVSTSLGLHSFDQKRGFEKLTDHPVMNTVINDIVVMNDSTYLLASSGSGTYLYRAGEWLNFSTQNGMSSDISQKVIVENDSTFWIGTNAGVNKVSMRNGQVQIKVIGYTDGLISEDVNDLMIKGDELIAATSKGISRISISGLDLPQSEPLINMKAMTVDDEPWAEDKEIPPGPNALSIHYDGLHFKSREALRYQYRLLGFDDTWRKTDRNTMEFSGLRSGAYTFEVKAINASGVESAIASKRFVISTPFWATWWFIGLLVVLVFAIVYWLAHLVIKRNKLKEQRKYELQLKIAEAERKALQSQLNPHFIFNSLNSIQNMVLDNNIDEVYQYLAKFGKLIRRVLEFSDLSMIPLEDELETLRLYIALENLRLNDKFDFEIKLSEDVELLTEIPSMIIQPYVENAIWHGVTPLKGQRRGVISISVENNEEGLKFEVSDNGVGRGAKRNKKEEGFGTRIVNELVRNHRGNRSGEVEIVDLYDDEKPCGTKVVVKLLPQPSI